MTNNNFDHGIANGYNNKSQLGPTYAVEHLVTFKVRHDSEMYSPKEKLKLLFELDKNGAIWPQKMYMSFNEQWLIILDSNNEEIENFPGTLIRQPTAFTSSDPLEVYNNILVFYIPGATLRNTEMHIFQANDVSAVELVEDLKALSAGKTVMIDRNKSTIKLPKPDRYRQNGKDQYGLAAAAAGAAAEKNIRDREQSERNILVLNHCFEDIERFIVRLQYAAEALRELESRQTEHTLHGEGLLISRSRPPTENEFYDILAKVKLAFNFITKLQSKLKNDAEILENLFISLNTIVKVCNDVYPIKNIPQNVVNPLLRQETISYLLNNLNSRDIEFWQSLGVNWTIAKEHVKDHKGSYHPIFYDDWSPDWVVDEDVVYVPLPHKESPISPINNKKVIWLKRLQSRNCKIVEVLYSKEADTDKELSVTEGEYLEVIDDSRNWWKVRNANGTIGYVPHTILSPHNFEAHHNRSGRDTESLASSQYEPEHEIQIRELQNSKIMPAVPEPPPLPVATESEPSTPTGTLTASPTMAAIRPRNNVETDSVFAIQNEINDELRLTLMQRERRKDLEILTTPNIYINQNSTPKEVEEWLRGKGFSDVIVKKLCKMNGAEIFALKPFVIESYFGHKESRRLISQIVLQKNLCEYKTVRSTELNAKLAKARQKADQSINDANEVF